MVSASRLAHARDQAGDREYPLRRYRYEVLRQDRLAALPRGSLRRMVRTWARADPVPDEGEWVRMVPVIGTAKQRSD